MAFAQSLQARRPEIAIFFATGPKALEREILASWPHEQVFRLHGRPWRRNRDLISAGFWLEWAKAMGSSWRLLERVSPRLTVGFGGYSVFGLVLLSSMRGIPTLIHEQNVELGRANRLLSHLALTVALSFRNERLLSKAPEKYVFTGMPLRPDLGIRSREEARGALGLDQGRRTLLIIGGSQGSRIMNACVAGLIESYGGRLSGHWQFIHLTGHEDHSRLEGIYKKSGLGYLVRSYEEDMSFLYSSADLVLSRAGSGTIFECAYFKRPMILVPHPRIQARQQRNAEIVSAKGGGMILPEDDLSPQALFEALEALRLPPDRLERMARAMGELSPREGNERLVSIALQKLGAP